MGISRSGRGFTPTTTSPSLLPGSGSILTTRTIPSGAETTSTMTSSPWSSCLAISSEECSRDWTNSTKTPSAPCVCSERTMTPPSAVSGYLRVMSSLSELDDNWKVDYSSYSWKKLDSKSDDCKKLVDQYWKWEGTDEKGRAFNQGKIFK